MARNFLHQLSSANTILAASRSIVLLSRQVQGKVGLVAHQKPQAIAVHATVPACGMVRHPKAQSKK
jgi:hypothetical protein